MAIYRFRVIASYEVEAESRHEAESILASALPPTEGWDKDYIEWIEGEIQLVEKVEA